MNSVDPFPLCSLTHAHTYRTRAHALIGVQLYLAWLSYFYLAMALRENVLYVNGSRIRAWWMQHVSGWGRAARRGWQGGLAVLAHMGDLLASAI